MPVSETTSSVKPTACAQAIFRWGTRRFSAVWRTGGCLGLACGLSVGCAHWGKPPPDTAAKSQRVIQRARTAEDRGDMPAAERLLSQSLAKNPEDAGVRWELVKLLIERGA